MSWMESLNKLISSRSTWITGALGTGGYITYNDHMRPHRLVSTFTSGNLTAPFHNNSNETEYFHRPAIEKRMRAILEPTFANEYYFIRGEVGSGKTRALQEIVREMIATRGKNKQGAPVYVLASQGKDFTDSLAEAVRFNFDEHVNFNFFLSYLLGINKFPGRDEKHKLIRVLNAIEKAASMYAERYERPAILVIDGTSILTEHYPGTLEKLQEKAKLWADENICKVVFVSNEDRTEDMLVKNRSCWNRAGNPLYIDDLTREESIQFLSTPYVITKHVVHKVENMTDETANAIYELVGGRIQHLIMFKKDASNKVPFEKTRDKVLAKDYKKFIGISKNHDIWRVVVFLWQQPDYRCHLFKVLESISKEVVDECIDRGILRLLPSHKGIIVEFESKLTQSIVDLMMRGHKS